MNTEGEDSRIYLFQTVEEAAIFAGLKRSEGKPAQTGHSKPFYWVIGCLYFILIFNVFLSG
jgi:hypothetical protein